MADAAVRFAFALAAACCVSYAAEPVPAPQEGSVPAVTLGPLVPNKKNEDEAAIVQSETQEARVKLAGVRCADATTQIMPIEQIEEALNWQVRPSTPDYRPLAMTYRTPTADYPGALLAAGVPGAVGLLLFIDHEGNVVRVEAACATDPAFVPLAVRVVRANRYRPSMVAGEPTKDLAYQIVAYGVSEY
jgi:hypothetical protein